MRTVKQTSLIIKYTNLLYAHGVGSRRAEYFKQKHSQDTTFLSRAKKLDSLFVLVFQMQCN